MSAYAACGVGRGGFQTTTQCSPSTYLGLVVVQLYQLCKCATCCTAAHMLTYYTNTTIMILLATATIAIIFGPHPFLLPLPPQAKELLDHLEDVLSCKPIVVSSGNTIVEVKPQGVSKGGVVEKILIGRV